MLEDFSESYDFYSYVVLGAVAHYNGLVNNRVHVTMSLLCSREHSRRTLLGLEDSPLSLHTNRRDYKIYTEKSSYFYRSVYVNEKYSQLSQPN